MLALIVENLGYPVVPTRNATEAMVPPAPGTAKTVPNPDWYQRLPAQKGNSARVHFGSAGPDAMK